MHGCKDVWTLGGGGRGGGDMNRLYLDNQSVLLAPEHQQPISIPILFNHKLFSWIACSHSFPAVKYNANSATYLPTPLSRCLLILDYQLIPGFFGTHSQSPLYQQILLPKSGLKPVCNVNIVYGNLKSENSQDYVQKPQRSCAFMNSTSGYVWSRRELRDNTSWGPSSIGTYRLKSEESGKKRCIRGAIAGCWLTFHHDGKISPAWWGRGVHAHPVQSCGVYAPSKRADTLNLFHL